MSMPPSAASTLVDPPVPGPSRGSTAPWLFVCVWAASVLYAVVYLRRGWIPHDLGSVAQPATRVLLGELPHRDFVDVYTGGLAFLNALALRALGETAMAMRWVVLGVYAAWIPVVWYVIRRFVGPVPAALATLLAASWTLPMYAEGMPGWYNLFFATFAAAGLFRYLEVRSARWLVIAGVAAGVSVLFKVAGLYAVAAGLLALAFLEVAEAPPRSGPETAARDVGYRWLVVAGALSLALAIVALVSEAMGPGGLFRFATAAVIPCVVLALRTALHPTGATTLRRLGTLVGLLAPFVGGVVMVGGVFLVPWLVSGSVGALVQGVFLLPQRRLADASWHGLWGGWLDVWLSATAVLAVAAAPGLGRRVRLGAGSMLAVALTALLVFSGRPRVYLAVWQALWWIPTWVALVAAWTLVARRGPASPEEPLGGRDSRLFLVAATFGLVSLVEVPFAAPIYFFYAAPLVIPLAYALADSRADGGIDVRRHCVTGLVVLLAGFTALRFNPGFIGNLGYRPDRDDLTVQLRLLRANGLRVSDEDRDLYETVVPLVEALAGGSHIYATPDTPELYFLTGKRNPTRTLFEFLDPHPENRASRVLDALDRESVEVAVVNRKPGFSVPVSPDLMRGLEARYPRTRAVGQFLVMWR